MKAISDSKLLWAPHPSREVDQYVAFRKTFETTADGLLALDLFADTYYNLSIDGAFIHRGPVRRHERSAQYDHLMLHLERGKHRLCVLVHWLGVECAAHRKGMAAFWCVGTGEGCEFVTDESWEARFCDEFISEGGMLGCYDFRENVDLRRADIGWGSAKVLGTPGSDRDVHKNYARRTMRPFAYLIDEGTILKRGETTVAGFDATLSGTAIVEYTGASDGDELVLAYDDLYDEAEHALPVLGKLLDYRDRFTLPPGDGKVEVAMPRGFRYVWASASGSCRIERISARRELYPYRPKTLATSSAFLNTLYEQSLRTQHICTIDGYTDCINRERVLWLGDAWIDAMSAYYDEVDHGLLVTTLYEHALGQNASGAIGGYNSSDLQPEWLYILSYNLMYIHMLCDYIRYTGRENDILPLKETARGILAYVRRGFNENGIYDIAVQGGGNFWDWGYSDVRGQSLKTNAFYLYTIERMKEFSFFDGIPLETDAELDILRQKCFHLFWDERRRIFHDGCVLGQAPDPLSTQLANALAVLSGICPDEMCDELLERIIDPRELDDIPYGENQGEADFTPNREKILPSGTMYSAMMVCMAMFERGRYDIGLRYMEEVWGPFRDLPTLPELRRNGMNNTMCHGWSGGAGYLIPRYLLGLAPEGDGWAAARLTPPDGLAHAQGAIPTPRGDVVVQWYQTERALKVAAVLPEGMALRVHWRGQTISLHETGDIVILRGNER